MKKLLTKVSAICLSITMALSMMPSFTAAASSVNVTNVGGWFETVYANWDSVSGASGYNVYYKQSGTSDYIQADAELVRGTRVDIPGLKAGNYDIKIVPVVSGSENASGAAEKSNISVMAHDRSGYAFKDGKTTGGYNEDGTVPSNATVLYVSEATKDSITANVITDTGKGTVTSCTGIGAIMKARQKSKAETTPLIVRIIGTVSSPSGADSASLLNIKATQNVTIEGIGTDALLKGWGLNIRDTKNIEVRNLAFKDFPDDSVSVQVDNSYIWIHNNDFMIGANGGGDKAKGDGSCDIKDQSTNVTISYNHFQNTGKSSLCGMKSETEFYVTYHHNWFEKAGSRHPRVRTGTVHVYNNYFDHVYSAGIAATMGSDVFVEANYFEDAVRPMMMAGQGADIKDDGDSFNSGEDGGVIKSYNNKMTTCGGSVTYLDGDLKTVTKTCSGCTRYTPGTDCYVANSRDEQVPSSFKAVKGGATYSNFDTASDFYQYTVDSPDAAKVNVVNLSGRLNENQTGGNTGTQEPTTQTTTQKIETTETTTAKIDGIYGDVDGNSQITAADAAQILAYVLNTDADFTNAQIKLANVDGNDQITASDAATVLTKVLNSDYLFPVEE